MACSPVEKKKEKKGGLFLRAPNPSVRVSDLIRARSELIQIHDPEKSLPPFWIVCSPTLFSFGGRVFHQVKGIPMGIQPAPLIANLFLAAYEFEFFQRLLAAAPGPGSRPP